MYNNIGRKIKLVAEATALVGTVIFLIIGLVMRLLDEDSSLIALLTIFAGTIFSWVMSFVMYGFGQLVQNSDKVLEILKKEKDV